MFGLELCLLCVVWFWLVVVGLLCGVWLGNVVNSVVIKIKIK